MMQSSWWEGRSWRTTLVLVRLILTSRWVVSYPCDSIIELPLSAKPQLKKEKKKTQITFGPLETLSPERLHKEVREDDHDWLGC